MAESEYIKNNNSTCLLHRVYLDNLDVIKNQTGNIPYKDQLGRYMLNNFDNPDVLKLATCIAEAISLKPDYDHLPGRQLRLRHFLGMLRYNNRGYYDSVSLNQFSLKFNFNPAIINHEFFVTKLFINKLRGYIPNFGYTYASVSCTAPIINDSGVITWCDRQSIDRFLIVENIPGYTLGQFLKLPIAAVGTFLSAFIQICYTVFLTSDITINGTKCHFTHNNLNADNIVLRPNNINPNTGRANNNGSNDTTSIFTIPYKMGNKFFFVRANTVATIINFDKSSLFFNNTNVYLLWLHIKRIDPENIIPIYDVFNLLISSYSLAPNAIKQEIIVLLQFFDKTINSNNISGLYSLDLPLPFLPSIVYLTDQGFDNHLTVENFINYLTDIIGSDFISINSAPRQAIIPFIPFCTYTGTCRDIDTLARQSNLTKPTIPSNPFDFYDLITTDISQQVEALGQTRTQQVSQLEEDKVLAINEYYAKSYLADGIRILVNSYNQHYNNLLIYNNKIPQIPVLQNVSNIYDVNTQIQYVNYLYNIAGAMEEVDTLFLLNAMYQFYYQNYNNLYPIPILSFDGLNAADVNIVTRLNAIGEDLAYLDNSIANSAPGDLRNNLTNFYNYIIDFTSFFRI